MSPARCYCRSCRPELFARRTDPVTSHEAAARARSSAVDHRNRIMAVLRDRMTVKDIAAAIADSSIDHVAVARRMSELQEQGRARPLEEKRDGCRLWVRS